MSSSNNIKPGILVDATVWQDFKEKTTNASDTLEKFMINYDGSSESGEAIIQVNKNIWENFKNKYQDQALKEVERLMQLAVSSPSASTNVMSVNTSFVNSMSIPSAGNWTVSYSNNSINLTNTAGSSTLTTYTNGTTSDILIDFNGDIK
jgi:hypothetical protein